MNAGPRNGNSRRGPRRSPARDCSAASRTLASPGRTSSSGWTRASRSCSRRGPVIRAPEAASGHDPIHLEALGELAVHVDAVHAGEVPHVLGIGVAAVLLRGVAGERGDLALEVTLLERDVRAVREVEVVPGHLVAEDRRPLEGAQALLSDRLVILVDVVVGRL